MNIENLIILQEDNCQCVECKDICYVIECEFCNELVCECCMEQHEYNHTFEWDR